MGALLSPPPLCHSDALLNELTAQCAPIVMSARSPRRVRRWLFPQVLPLLLSGQNRASRAARLGNNERYRQGGGRLLHGALPKDIAHDATPIKAPDEMVPPPRAARGPAVSKTVVQKLLHHRGVKMVQSVGFAPTASPSRTVRSTRLNYDWMVDRDRFALSSTRCRRAILATRRTIQNGRTGEIRTHDLVHPMHAR